jgi:hypothetical protein
MQIKLLSTAAALSLAFGITAAGGAYAQSTTTPSATTDKSANRMDKSADRKARKAEEERIEADANAAKAKCDPMKGNEKDVCEAEAKAKEKLDKAELAARHDATPRNQRKVEEAKAEGDYEVAKERCESNKDAVHACKKEAKAKYDKARADIKAKHARADQKNAGTGSTQSVRTK